ncbi:MAG: hypothetical protein ACRCYQ_16925 [Nocardioides sp.]
MSDSSGITVIGGRLTMSSDFVGAPHVRAAQVRVPLFAEPPVIVAMTAGRSGPDVDPSSVGNPGALVVVWNADYKPETDHALVTLNAARSVDGEPLLVDPDPENGVDEVAPITIDCDYIVMGLLARVPAP